VVKFYDADGFKNEANDCINAGNQDDLAADSDL
jgi:hypothetical protein